MGVPEQFGLAPSPNGRERATPAPVDQQSRPDETMFAAEQIIAPPSAYTPTPSTDDRYRLLDLYGQGGMGRIWVAHDQVMDRDIALKELHHEYVHNSAALARFLREARITSQLEHPGVVPVYEVVRPGGDQSPFYTMRFVRGRTMTQAAEHYHQKLRTGEDAPLALAALLQAFVMVCNTVGYAHARGVLHRDLKGQNVLLGDFGEVVVLDWGLAKLIGKRDPSEAALTAPIGIAPNDPTLTQHGQALGTPASMAPEQAAGKLDELDQRTDIYGLGTILYEILTGHQPFDGPTSVDVLWMVMTEEPKPPRQLCPSVPAGLEAICLRALAKNPADRYPTAKQLGDAVQQWQESERRQAEAALRASEEQYHTLADLIPGIVWTARADGWIEYANQFWFKFTGLTMEQTQGTGWTSVIHPRDLPRVNKLWTEALRAGTPLEMDFRLRRAVDGVYRWFLAQAKPLRDKEGRVTKWFGMLTEIEEHKQDHQALERQNVLVHLLHQVTVAAYEAPTFEAALQATTHKVCAHTGWPVGHVYLRSEDGAELRPTKIWSLNPPEQYADFVRVTEANRMPAGIGLPGRVLADRKPHWIKDVVLDANFPRAQQAANLKSAFAFPVLTKAGVIAVLEFYTSEPYEPDKVLLEAMSQIGLQLGLVYERKRADAELRAIKVGASRQS